jgi:hypothetical protein
VCSVLMLVVVYAAGKMIWEAARTSKPKVTGLDVSGDARRHHVSPQNRMLG